MLELNKTKLIHGDCLNVINQFPDNSIDVCLTDPPYGIDFQSSRKTDKSKQHPKIKNDIFPFTDWIKPLYSKMNDGGRLICFYRWDVQDAFLYEIIAAGFNVKSQLVWDKVVHGMGDLEGEFAPRHELMIYATKGRYTFKGKRPTTMFRHQRVNPVALIHPNEKPVKLLTEILLSISEPNEIVFEPFAGSGAMIETCMKTDRTCIATELDDHYFKIASDRISKVKVVSSLNFF